MQIYAYIIAALGGYLLGSIPTGFVMGKLKGMDIRQHGSGNIGATNVLRLLGKPTGALVLAIDALKGYLACVFLARLIFWLSGSGPGEGEREWFSVICGVSAILGHNYTCWLKFRGGKGIATSAGVLVGLVPWALLVILIVWLVVFGFSRYVSLASIAAAAALPPAVWLTRGTPFMIGLSLFLSGMAIYKHRTNLRRLLDGTEHRFSRADQAGESGPKP